VRQSGHLSLCCLTCSTQLLCTPRRRRSAVDHPLSVPLPLLLLHQSFRHRRHPSRSWFHAQVHCELQRCSLQHAGTVYAGIGAVVIARFYACLGVAWSRGFRSRKSLAAAFRTRCSGARVAAGRPARTALQKSSCDSARAETSRAETSRPTELSTNRA